MLLKISTKQKGSYGMKKELLVELNNEELETVNGGQLEYLPVDWEVVAGGLAGFGGGAGGGGGN